MYRQGGRKMVCGPLASRPLRGGCRCSKPNNLLSLYARAHETCTHAQRDNNTKNRECGKLEFSTLSTGFQQQVHKKIRHNNEFQQFQQVINKTLNKKKEINKRSNVKKRSFQHFQHYYYYYYNKLILRGSEVSTGTR